MYIINLKACIEDEFRQVVIIGAGYDTRAYRIEGVKENLSVFEVDHPMTQQVKIEIIKEIFGELPDHVTYVPVTFGQDQLPEKLFGAGYFTSKGRVVNVTYLPCLILSRLL